MQKNYRIAAKYYSTILKVYPFLDGTSLSLGTTCGNITVPSAIQNGFDVALYDTAILTRVYSDTSSSSIVAFAGPCVFARRPVIGQLNYRASSFSAKVPGTDRDFH